MFEFKAIVPDQAQGRVLIGFPATASQILAMANIDRIGRDDDGEITGMQRPAIKRHITEIRDYIEQPGAIVPNSIVVGALASQNMVHLDRTGNRKVMKVTVDPSLAKGWLVDGQQRVTAAASSSRADEFEFFVSLFLCGNEDELREQFVLVNSSKPLSKALINELLPKVQNIPARLARPKVASMILAMLNNEETSRLRGQVKMHTHKNGLIKDTHFLKVIVKSLEDGACRRFLHEDQDILRCVEILSNFYGAVQQVFASDWEGHKPTSSRLVHGAGIRSLGFVMEYLHSETGAYELEDFVPGLEALKPHAHWTSGAWQFSPEDVRPWNAIQVVGNHISDIAFLLVDIVRDWNRGRK